MKLYNTLTKQIDTLTPLSGKKVSIYTCGPTVYDYPHIGNWFTFIRYDLLVRSLKLGGYAPYWVLNITDVGHLISDADEGEDKLETGARREGKSAQQIADFYSDYFINALTRLNFTKADVLPKATEHIAEQIALIQTLEHKGYTYQISDGIYFDTSKFAGYAKLANLDLDNQTSSRIEANPNKHRSSDFALWKFSPKDAKRDMEWDSPWGNGFPGWHIECSAMILKYLGETIDIHSGGIDHIPVHHTNEIAQSQAATGQPLANIWMHTNHILLDAQKISKSLGNGITLEDIEEQGINLAALRLLVIQSHYRTQSKFSWEVLTSAQNLLNNLYAWSDLRHQQKVSERLSTNYAEAKKSIVAELMNDLNTPAALAILNGMVNRIDELGVDSAAIAEAAEFINMALGLDLVTPDINQAQKELIAKRDTERQANNWAAADEIRQQLQEQGIVVSDSPSGALWSWQR